MISRDAIIKIIEYGTHAPSGDNSQPWRFEVTGSTIRIFNIPGKDNPILNVRNRGSFVAHGAAVQNMVIAAAELGFKSSLEIFPAGNPHLVASLTLREQAAQHESLFNFITERVTNRKPYKKEPLTEEEKRELRDAARGFSGGELTILEKRSELLKMARALSVTEKVALLTPELHELFFGGMLWDEEENRRGESGLYIKTIEVPPPVQFLFRLIKRWPVMRLFNAVGFPKIAARVNAALYASSAALGAFIVNDTDEDFFHAGGALQRVWLTATKLGLAVQPVTGVLFLHQRVRSPEGHPFSRKNEEAIEEAYGIIENAFSSQGKIIAMLFRVGKNGEPSARSYRKKPEITFRI